MDLPAISINGFPGNLEEAKRAGIIPITFIFLALKVKPVSMEKLAYELFYPMLIKTNQIIGIQFFQR
ncbi:hypothetical protein D3C86_1709690 [compost metagenome]